MKPSGEDREFTSTEKYKFMQNRCLELFSVKNEQYGDNFKVYGLLGVTCELLGALARLPKLVLWSQGHGRTHGKNIEDILMDIHNYATMALICIEDDNWDGSKSDGS